MTADFALDEVVLLVARTLLHFLWQGAVLGGVAVLLSVTLQRRARAQAWWTSQFAVFVMMLLCPVVTAVLLLPGSPTVSAPIFTAPSHTVGIASETRPFVSLPDDGDAVPPFTSLPVRVEESEAVPTLPAPVETADQNLFERVAPLVAVLYAVGVAFMLLRLIVGVRGGRRLRASAQAIADAALLAAVDLCARGVQLRRIPVVALSERVAVATVVGFVRPIVLLPVHIQTGFTPAQIEMLLLHEFAHLRRYDHWVALAQRLGEAMLFFHPAVWYVSRQISAAREHCCDDMVLGLGKTPLDYAKTLLHAGEDAALDVNSAVAALHSVKAPSQLRRRIARILRSELQVKAAPSRVSIFVVLMLIAGSVIAVAATTQDDRGEQLPQESAEPVAEPAETEPEPPEDAPIVLAQDPATAGPAGDEPATGQTTLNEFEVGELLLQIESGDPWVSKLAALEMGKSGDPFFLHKLTALLSSQPAAPEARAAAAEALGMLADPRAVPYLVSALRHFVSQGSSISTAAEQALAKIKDDSVVATLKVAVADDDPPLRAGAYSALAYIGTPEAYALLLDSGLRDTSVTSPDAATQLARAAKEDASLGTKKALVAALDSRDPVIAQQAMLALVKLDASDTNRAVVNALERNSIVPSEWTMQGILQSSLIEQATVCKALTGQLMAGKYKTLSANTRSALGEKIIASGNIPASSEQQAALYVATGNYSIAPSFGRAAVQPLIEALPNDQEYDPRTIVQRVQIIEALGVIGDPSALNTLEQELNVFRGDGYGHTVVSTIAKIGGEGAQPILLRALKHRTAEARNRAAYELAVYKDETTVDALILCLRDLDEGVRATSARSLGTIQSRRAVEPLLAALYDLDDGVRTNAARALASVGSDEAVDALAALLETGERSDVTLALDAFRVMRDPRAIEVVKAYIERNQIGNGITTPELQEADRTVRYLEAFGLR